MKHPFLKLKDTTGFDCQASHVTNRPQDVKNAFCSARKARELLGYHTTRSLHPGLDDHVSYIRAVGPRKFRYHLDIKIRNQWMRRTWTKRLV